MSMITATTWVPRGYAAAFPTKYVFDEEEYERISKLAKLELDDAKEDLAEAQAELNAESNEHGAEKKATSAARHVGGGVALPKDDEDMYLPKNTFPLLYPALILTPSPETSTTMTSRNTTSSTTTTTATKQATILKM